MRTIYTFVVLCLIIMICSCAKVTVTKTAKGFFPPTDADNVEVLVLEPKRDFTELATVVTQHWETRDTAKMHNSLRSKCSALGADAVILGASGIDHSGYYWSSGVAIRYK
jgi:hypothetical protein